MKNILIYFLLLFTIISCKKEILKADLANLNGYWEIEKVTFPNGKEKDYKINENIDFFEIKNDSGFRKKVAPQFNGKYIVNDVFEKIKINNTNDKFFITYKTNYSDWKEEILEISKEKLILKNDSSVEYQYKKSIPFSLK